MRKKDLLIGSVIVILGMFLIAFPIFAFEDEAFLNYGEFKEYAVNLEVGEALEWRFSTFLDVFNVIFEIDGSVIVDNQTVGSGTYVATKSGIITLVFTNAEPGEAGYLYVKFDVVEEEVEDIIEETPLLENPIFWFIVVSVLLFGGIAGYYFLRKKK